MTDILVFAMETLPSVLGLILIVYALLQINKEKAHFFEAARSWIMIAFMASLTVLWIYEFARTLLEGTVALSRTYVDLTFVVAVMWLSTCMVALSTVYRRYNSIEHLIGWLRDHPVNVITAWGAIAIGVLVPVWFTDLRDKDALRENTWILVLVFVYIALSVAIDAAMALRARARRPPRMDGHTAGRVLP
jgi:hypothetical protein